MPKRVVLVLLLLILQPISYPNLLDLAAPNRAFVITRVYYADQTGLAWLRDHVDVWAVHAHQAEQYADALVRVDQFWQLAARGYRLEIDWAHTAQYAAPRSTALQLTGGIPGYACYRTVEETYASAQALAAVHPALAQWIDIGDSWEEITPGGNAGYDLMVLKLTNQAVPGPKPKLFVMASIHAREYAPAELNTRFAEYLINNYEVEADVTWLLDYNEVHLLLQANPDGRKFAEAGLMWRKNTNNNYCANTDTRGADLNRNFPFYWNSCSPGAGCSSGQACNLTYRGPSAASEPETQTVIDYVRAQFPDQRGADLSAAAPVTTSGVFMDLHSYGELVLWPWGFTSAPAPNAAALQTLGRKLAYFNDYTPQAAIGLYPTDGTTDDFAYGELGLAAYTIEMGTTFFQPCPAFENTLYPDNLPALFYALKSARQPYLSPSGPDTLDVSATPAIIYTGPLTLTATADDTRYRAGTGEPTQAIAATRYSIDAPSWITSTHPLTAADGSFDSPIEALHATIDLTELAVGRHSIFIESRDAAGNWGPPSAVFVWITTADKQWYLPIVRRDT